VLHIEGRANPVTDDHKIGRAPLSEVLRWSSNIGIIKFTERLSAREEFETLRDFGFGTPTGLPYPSESPGLLRSPKSWSKQSPHSLAMGYEISATPLQLALAYATFANGGELVEPALVKKIVAPDGTVRFEHRKRIVRQVVSRATAEKVRKILLEVVDEGTAKKAGIDNYILAGKTGTPRATVRGRYVEGRHNPNFVGLFPGDNPQYVIVVKMTAPRTSSYAAETAAPVTKAILEAAVAAQAVGLDRTRLAASMVPTKKDTALRTSVSQAGVPAVAMADDDTSKRTLRAPFVVTLPVARPKPPARVAKAIPDVRGMALRDAVRSLHSAGFRVQLAQTGTAGLGGNASVATSPAAGELAPTGTLVRLLFDY
jgi:cell division protein FtsI (penicillin-binding protein 3)